jgi:hypothetical protein
MTKVRVWSSRAYQWILDQKLSHYTEDWVVDPSTFQNFPHQVWFTNEQDLTLYLLRWR